MRSHFIRRLRARGIVRDCATGCGRVVREPGDAVTAAHDDHAGQCGRRRDVRPVSARQRRSRRATIASRPAVREQALAKAQVAELAPAAVAKVAGVADHPRRSWICRLSVESSRR